MTSATSDIVHATIPVTERPATPINLQLEVLGANSIASRGRWARAARRRRSFASIAVHPGVYSETPIGTVNAAAALASDTFNRADSSDLGANWDAGAPQGGITRSFSVVSNTAKAAVSNVPAWETNNSVTWPADQYSEITLAATGAYSGRCGGGGSLAERATRRPATA